MLNDAAVSHFKKVYLAPGYTDLRRGIDGFASIVRFQFELDPYDKNTLFLFCGRKKAAGSRHQINCLILLMSVHSRFVCTVFQICSFIGLILYTAYIASSCDSSLFQSSSIHIPVPVLQLLPSESFYLPQVEFLPGLLL